MRLNIISRHSLKNRAVFIYCNLYNIIDIVHIYITCFGHAWHYIYHLWISRFSLSMEKLMHALILNETLYYVHIFRFFPMNFYWRKSQMRSFRKFRFFVKNLQWFYRTKKNMIKKSKFRLFYQYFRRKSIISRNKIVSMETYLSISWPPNVENSW